MHESRTFKIKWFLAISAFLFIVSCHFPYEPTTFVLPQPPVSPYIFPDSSTIRAFLGTRNAKIAYALSNNGAKNIYYVDFSDSAPAPKQLKKPAANPSIDSDKPLFSPDGKFVTYDLLAHNNDIYGAYIQRLDTVSEPVKIAANGARPHWYTDATGSLYIIYSTVFFIPTTTMSTGLGATYKQKVDTTGGGSPIGPPDSIAPYPMIGGLSQDGNYLCTGYEAACFYYVPTATLIPINNPVQICNPSIDPDPAVTNRMMFLNFAGVQAMTNPFATNDPAYPANSQGVLPMHSVLFIVDASNTVINFIPISIMGSAYSAWQCPQWSNNPDYAAALASSNDNNTEWDLVLIKNVGSRGKEAPLKMNLGSGQMNTESTPSLWIGN